jgi:hypothetical protein
MLQIFKRNSEQKSISEDRRFAEAQALFVKLNAECVRLSREIEDVQGGLYLRTVDPRDPIAKALSSIDGTDAADIGDSQARIAAARRKLETLGPAIRAQREVVDKVRRELSIVAAKGLQPDHRRALLELLEAARTLSARAEAEREIRVNLFDRGFTTCDSILPPPMLRGSLVIGDEENSTSDLSIFARQLRELGLDKS